MRFLLLLVLTVVTVAAIPRPIEEDDKRELFARLVNLLERHALDKKCCHKPLDHVDLKERTCTDVSGLWPNGDDKLTCAEAAKLGWCLKYSNFPTDCCQSCSNSELTQYCNSNPCINGGSCVYVAPEVGYSCSCSTGFSGDHCEFQGTCSDFAGTIGDEKLTCAQAAGAGWCLKYSSLPDTCCNSCSDKTLTKYCEPNPCQNDGVCAYVDNPAQGLTCQCVNDYQGARCELSSCSDDANMVITFADNEYDCPDLMKAHPDKANYFCTSNANIGEKCCASCSDVV